MFQFTLLRGDYFNVETECCIDNSFDNLCIGPDKAKVTMEIGNFHIHIYN